MKVRINDFILGFVMIILSCNLKNDSKNNAAFEVKDKVKINEIRITGATLNNKSTGDFSLYSLDTSLESYINEKLIYRKVSKKDSIELYKGLTDVFQVEGLVAIGYKLLKSSPEINPLTSIPGKRAELVFEDDKSAMNSFNKFVNDLRIHHIKGKIAIKAGGICFLIKNTIHLIPVSSCSSTERINYISKIIKTEVLEENNDKAVKFFCGLQIVENL